MFNVKKVTKKAFEGKIPWELNDGLSHITVQKTQLIFLYRPWAATKQAIGGHCHKN